MKLKRHYDESELKLFVAARDEFVAQNLPDLLPHMSELQATQTLRGKFAEKHRPPAKYCEIVYLSRVWRPTKARVYEGVREGWINLIDGRLVIKTPPGDDDVVFRIRRVPGRYSCYTGESLGSEAEAKAHVAEQGAKSPDLKWPAGYEVLTAFECEIDETPEAADA